MLGWLTGLFTQLFAVFGFELTKKTAYATAAIAAFLSLTLVFTLGIKVLISAIIAPFPDIPTAAFAFVPQNLSLCASTVISAKMARFIYDYNVQALKMVAGIH
jgi:hypothetical protein